MMDDLKVRGELLPKRLRQTLTQWTVMRDFRPKPLPRRGRNVYSA
jgi:hypothetical protein